MTVQALYVYKPTSFAIDRGVIEPLLMASGERVGDVIRTQQIFAPGLYRVPPTAQFHPVNGGDFETQDIGTVTANGKDGGLPDPPPRSRVLLKQGNESDAAVVARIKSVIANEGDQYTI